MVGYELEAAEIAISVRTVSENLPGVDLLLDYVFVL